jgi:hypothetical protein
MARSFLAISKDYSTLDSIVFIRKEPASYLDKKGMVYYFKYRVKKEDDWKIGISGLQPLDEKSISTDDKITVMTEKKIKPEEPLDEQLQSQLKKRLFTFYKSGRNFYGNTNNGSIVRAISSYED